MIGARRGTVTPELVDQHITMDRLVRAEQKNRQQRALLWAADVNDMPVAGNF